MIDVKNLHKSFGDKQVLSGIDEQIEKGEKVVLTVDSSIIEGMKVMENKQDDLGTGLTTEAAE